MVFGAYYVIGSTNGLNVAAPLIYSSWGAVQVPSTFEALCIVVLFLLPGSIVYQVISPIPLFRGGTYGLLTRSAILSGCYDLLVFGACRLVGFSPAVFVKDIRNGLNDVTIAGLFVLFLVIPALLGIAGNHAFLHTRYRRAVLWLMGWGGLSSQTPPEVIPTTWDFVFGKRMSAWLYVTMEDGSNVIGWYGGESFASSYPDASQVFLEAIYTETDDGSLKDLGCGCLLSFDKVKAIQVYWQSEEKTERRERNER